MRVNTSDTVDTIMQGLPVTGSDEKVIVACPDDSVAEACLLFLRFNLHHLPVIASRDDETVIGIVSTVDVMRFQADAPTSDPKSTPLRRIMTTSPVTIRPDATIKHAVELLATATYQALPVVNGNGRILGIVTTRDIVCYLNDHYRKPPLSLRPTLV
jgi:CBS domain-containing protein